MSYTPKDWRNATTHEGGGDTSTPLSAAAIEDLETRLSDYTDLQTPDVFGVAAPTGVEATDTAAIRATVTACDAAGGGVVQLQPGTYLVDTVDNPSVAGYYAAVHLPGGVSLRGAGMYATTIQLDANSANHASASIIQNLNVDASPADEGIVISDLTVDGDGANQTNYVQGIDLVRTRDCHYKRVRVRNIFGDAAFPPGETFHLYFLLSGDVSATDCVVEGTAGTQGSGIGCSESTNVIWSRCRVRGMSEGFGFAEYYSASVLRSDCIAQRCYGGFNAEYSTVRSVNCISGARAAVSVGSPYPYTTGQDLGNDSSGFIVNVSDEQHSNCIARNNETGVSIVGGTVSKFWCSSGDYTANAYGMSFGGTAELNCRVGHETNVRGTIANWALIGGNQGVFGTELDRDMTGPSVPASTTAINNPFPFDCNVFINGGTISAMSMEGATIGGVHRMVRVRAGATIALTYSSAPTWTWVRA